MASGGYDANQDYSSDCVDECLIEKLCASCIKKLIPRQTKVINELTKNVLCSNCRAVVVQDGFKNHDIILVKKTDYDSTGVDMKGLDKCMQHKKNVKFYCEDHDRLCCSGCVIAHRKCDNFNEINAFSFQVKEKELQSALIKVKEDSISIKHKIKELKAEMSETIINLSLDIDEIKNKVLKRIDDDKRLFLQETESITAEKTVSLEKRTDEMLKIEKDMSEALELFSISIQKGTPQQQWIVARAVSEMLRNAQTVIEGQRRNPLSMQMHLCFSRELTQLLHTEQNRVRLHIEEECKRADCSGLSALMSTKLRDNNPNIADLSDQFRPTKLAEMFSELYDNEWTTAYSTVNKILYGAERETIDVLLDMFMITYVFCNAEMEESWQHLTRWFLVEEDKSDATVTKPLKDRRKRGILKHVKYFPRQIEQIVASIGADDRVSHLLSNDDVKAYLLECARLCLLMAASDPPVFVECPGRPKLGLEERVLEVKQQKSSQGISTRQTGRNTNGQTRASGTRIQFNKAIYKEYSSRGAFLDYVVWPVMYINKGGTMLSRGVAQGTGEKTLSLEKGSWIWWK